MSTPTAQIQQWLSDFGTAVSHGQFGQAATMFGDDSYWRDLVSFSWNIKTAEGLQQIQAMLEATMPAARPSNFAIQGEGSEANGVTEGWFTFETATGRGRGHLRLIGGKAWSLARMSAMGLPVPPAFVVTTTACRAYLANGTVPEGLPDELAQGIAALEAATGRRFGRGPRALLVSVRSGAAISMPGMMDTVLNLGMTDEAEAALAAESGDAAFARDSHRRFVEMYARIVLKATLAEMKTSDDAAAWRAMIDENGVVHQAPLGKRVFWRVVLAVARFPAGVKLLRRLRGS